ncbi:alpha/beta hydrolase [Caballeronia novacaledonica]|uniref:alpha/beta hydrolase n=1 Tax=Caballeronia novacaledonica TaxID=1544861 RepID=UPI001EE2830B|nr:alpha/beta hydrolase [Caballeronia novacaledonica]GJH14217.1 alpha/beta hydrolase [Caballeronia novacaledonica]
MAEIEKAVVTAGLRGANWDPALMRRPYKVVPYALQTADGQKTLGFLFSRTGTEKTVVSIMHPREMSVTHYLVPSVLDAGCACWVQGPRSIGNDLRLEHEIALLDVAAGMSHLRALDFKNIVLLGNSGGGALYAFYNQQSNLAPEARIRRTPGGRPTGLSEAEMPTADGLILVSPHPGQGTILLNSLDPSVGDENDPMSVDSALDPFSAENGYDLEARRGHYSQEFVQRYKAAQIVRAEKLDAHSRELIARKQEARKRVKDGIASASERRVAGYAPIFQVWRTDADLRAWDTSIDPSDRKVGSLWGNDPFTSNWGSVAFGRVVTPESWLSTWSGLSSNASFAKCASSIEAPTLLLEYTGDQCAYPEDFERIYSDIAAKDKSRVKVRGNHHGMALTRDDPSGREVAGQHIGTWLDRTFAS